jgi:protein SCO1/2
MASPQPHGSRVSKLFAAIAPLALAAVIAAGCGSSDKNSSAGSTTAASAANVSKYEAAGVLEPIRQAPPLELKNYLGQTVNIDQYRGKAVLVTFVYTHCPDVCPLIVSNLHNAQALLGKEASKAQVIAVSVDPKGDTPKSVSHFLAVHEQTGKMQYLIGNTKELAAAWQAWGVGAEKDAGHPDLVEHSGLVYGITGSGKRVTIYSANFKPSEIAHDVPLLAAD